MLDGKRSKMRVRHQVAVHARLGKQVSKDLGVAFGGCWDPESHAMVRCHALAIGTGGLNIRGLVTSRR
jgi:hypothetical protein